jgi:hypothetical protein
MHRDDVCAVPVLALHSQCVVLTFQASAEEAGELFPGIVDTIAVHVQQLLGYAQTTVETARGVVIPDSVKLLVNGIELTINRMVGYMNDAVADGVIVAGYHNVDEWGAVSVEPSVVSPVTKQLCLRLGGHGLFSFEDPSASRYNAVAKQYLRLQFGELVKTIGSLSQEDSLLVSGLATGVTAYYTLQVGVAGDHDFGTCHGECRESVM